MKRGGYIERKTPLVRKGKLRARSDKKTMAMHDRARVLMLLRIERGNVCELRRHRDCRRRAEGLHETVKQSAMPWRPGDYERGREVLLACNVCNGDVEDRPNDAADKGHAVSKYSDDAKRLSKWSK